MSKMFVLGALLVLGVCDSKASGDHFCGSINAYSSNNCRYDEYCCRLYKNLCCDKTVLVQSWLFIIGVPVSLFMIAVVLICVWVCCKSTTQSGVVLRAPSTTTGACTYYTVPVTNPPQQLSSPLNPNYTLAMNTENSSCLYSLPAHQDAASSHFKMPPPAYNQAVGVQL